MITIYALADPETRHVRYIGKANNLKRRIQNHLCPSALERKHHRANWLRSLKEKGLRPEVIVLEYVNERRDWKEAERHWIAYYRDKGAQLVNMTTGGEGGNTGGRLGKPHTQATKEKISASKKGRQIQRCGEDTLKKRGSAIRAAWQRRRELGIENRDGKSISREQREQLSQIARSDPRRKQQLAAALQKRWEKVTTQRVNHLYFVENWRS